MKIHKGVLIWGMLILFCVSPSDVKAFVTCGYHLGDFPMTAYYWNSEFWVNMLVEEAKKWNGVYPQLSIERVKSSTVPVGDGDGKSIISWISEDALRRYYNFTWENAVGYTAIWTEGDCGKIIEADLFFNPSISLFTPQTRVPYKLGFQEIALHELGHVLGHDHEDRATLAVMISEGSVSDVLYASDKVGWLRSANFLRFNAKDKPDMGIFPLRKVAKKPVLRSSSVIPATAPPGVPIKLPVTVKPGDSVKIRNFTVQNLSSSLVWHGASFEVLLQNIATDTSSEIGTFFWDQFCAYCEWSGDLTYRVPSEMADGTYFVVAARSDRGPLKTADLDHSNDRAVLGTIKIKR